MARKNLTNQFLAACRKRHVALFTPKNAKTAFFAINDVKFF